MYASTGSRLSGDETVKGKVKTYCLAGATVFWVVGRALSG